MDNPAKIQPGLIFYDDDAAFANPVFAADLVLSESHAVEVSATRNPVEKGVDVTDHLRADPQQFAAEMFLTGTPLEGSADRNANAAIYLGGELGVGIAAAQASNTRREWEERLAAVYSDLERLARGEGPRGASLFKVATSIKIYKNMALVRVELGRQSSSELSAKIRLSFSEVRVVGTMSVPAMINPAPATPKQKKKSEAARQSQESQNGGPAATKKPVESWLKAGTEGRANPGEVVLGSLKGLLN